MRTISLAMIVKDESDTIGRILSAAKSFCDEMIVVDTGSSDDTVAKAISMGAKVYHYNWTDDFAAARNFSFSKCKMDWIIWLDGDDLILDEDQLQLQKFKFADIDVSCEAIYARYIYPPFSLWRERLVPRKLFGSKLNWGEPIHEYIQGIDSNKTIYRSDIRIVHDTPDGHTLRKLDRNICILRKHFERGARDERTIYNYAVECLHSFLLEEGQKVLKIFFNEVKNSVYTYEILIKMYDFYMHFGERARATTALTRAIAEDPTRGEAYYRMGFYICDVLDRPEEAIPLYTLASSISMPDYGTPELKTYGYGPLVGLSQAYFRLGNLTKAQRFAQKALRHNPPNSDFLKDLSGFVSEAQGRRSLPIEWHEWAASNLARNVPRHTVIRILEENKFTPNQILAAIS